MSTFSGVQTLEDPERNRSSKENREKAVYRCASTMASNALVNYDEFLVFTQVRNWLATLTERVRRWGDRPAPPGG